MATSEDLVNKLFINPLDSISRKLKSSRRRHTSVTIQHLGQSAGKGVADFGVKSRHESVDYGLPIPVEVKEFQVTRCIVYGFQALKYI